MMAHVYATHQATCVDRHDLSWVDYGYDPVTVEINGLETNLLFVEYTRPTLPVSTFSETQMD